MQLVVNEAIVCFLCGPQPTLGGLGAGRAGGGLLAAASPGENIVGGRGGRARRAGGGLGGRG